MCLSRQKSRPNQRPSVNLRKIRRGWQAKEVAERRKASIRKNKKKTRRTEQKQSQPGPKHEQLEDSKNAQAEEGAMMTMRRIMKENLCINCWASDHRVEICGKERKGLQCGEVDHMVTSCPKIN